MTKPRWKVTKASAPTGSGKIWQVWEDNQRRKVLHTWREAMDYADRMSRTIEVELPRNPHRLIDVGIRREIERVPTDYDYITITVEYEITIRYWGKSLEEVALALLALTKRPPPQEPGTQ